MVSLHHSLPGSVSVSSNNWGGSHSARSDVKFLLEVFDVEPERKIFLAEVTFQEFAKEGA